MRKPNACCQSPRAAASRARSTRLRPELSLIARLPSLAAERNRERYRRNSLAHAPREGTTGLRANEQPRGETMKTAKVNGVELEYEVAGSGEPVLLISPVLADGFLPLLSEPVLADRYQ